MSRKIRHVAKEVITYTALHLFAGIGGGARGFQEATAKVAGVEGRFETLVGIDVDAAACDDFEMLTGAPSACIDLFTREQYVAFHTKWKRIDGEWVAVRPAVVPDGWEEATPKTIRDACRGRAPDIVFLSPPCKGLSGLLSGKLAGSPKYQALNDLVCRGLWLVSEAFKDDPPRLIILENVPRIQTRGRALIDRNIAMLSAYGYATQEGRHNCGKIGNMAQSRERFFFIARRCESVAPFLYQPPEHPLRPMGEEVLKLPLPFDPAAGPMHRLSERTWLKTWIRLALIRAGRDWRDLKKWAPGTFRLDGTRHSSVYRVVDTTGEPSPAITAGGGPSSAAVGSGLISTFDMRMCLPAVTDARPAGTYRNGTLGMADLEKASSTVIAAADPWATGDNSAPDPRPGQGSAWHNGAMGVHPLDEPAGTVCGSSRMSNGVFSTTDPRPTADWNQGVFGVADGAKPIGTVCARSASTNGAFSIADVRELAPLPDFWPDTVPVLLSPHDGMMHRPLTVLELAVLQGLPWQIDGQPLKLHGNATGDWRGRIGNMVPPPAAKAIATEMLKTLLSHDTRHPLLGFTPIWVSPSEWYEPESPAVRDAFAAAGAMGGALMNTTDAAHG